MQWKAHKFFLTKRERHNKKNITSIIKLITFQVNGPNDDS
jgi:hypothetical protein